MALRRQPDMVEKAKELFQAIKDQDCDRVRTVLINSTQRELFAERNAKRQTPLHYAVHRGNYETFKCLLDYSSALDLEVMTPDGKTPLYLAGALGYKDMFMELLRRGANPNGGHYRSFTVLDQLMRDFCWERREDYDDMMYVLVQKGAIHHNRHIEGSTSFASWVAGCDLRKTLDQVLSMKNKGPHVIKRSDITTLMDRNMTGILAVLLNHKCYSGADYLGEVVSRGQLEMVRMFLNHGVFIDGFLSLPYNHRAERPLHVAIVCGHTEVALALLDHGASVHLPGAQNSACTPLETAVERGHIDLTMILLERGGTTRENQKCLPKFDPGSRAGYITIVNSGLVPRYPMLKLIQSLRLTVQGRAIIKPRNTGVIGDDSQRFRNILHCMVYQTRIPYDIQMQICRIAISRIDVWPIGVPKVYSNSGS